MFCAVDKLLSFDFPSMCNICMCVLLDLVILYVCICSYDAIRSGDSSYRQLKCKQRSVNWRPEPMVYDCLTRYHNDCTVCNSHSHSLSRLSVCALTSSLNSSYHSLFQYHSIYMFTS